MINIAKRVIAICENNSIWQWIKHERLLYYRRRDRWNIDLYLINIKYITQSKLILDNFEKMNIDSAKVWLDERRSRLTEVEEDTRDIFKKMHPSVQAEMMQEYLGS
jgi:hypothetical protein